MTMEKGTSGHMIRDTQDVVKLTLAALGSQTAVHEPTAADVGLIAFACWYIVSLPTCVQ